MDGNNNIIGRGWKFPPRFDAGTGKSIMAEGVDDINQSLYILLTPGIGERIMQPNYGSALKNMIFESMNEHFKSYMRLVMNRSILLYEPRIRPLKIDFSEGNLNDGQYLMHLEYIVLETKQKNSFVFPFYLNAT